MSQKPSWELCNGKERKFLKEAKTNYLSLMIRPTKIHADYLQFDNGHGDMSY